MGTTSRAGNSRITCNHCLIFSGLHIVIIYLMLYRSLFVLFAFHSKTLDCPFLIYHFWLPIWCLQSFLPPLDQVQDQSYKLDTEYHRSSSDTTIYVYCIYYMLVSCSRKCVYYNSVTTFIFLYYSAQFHAFTYGSFRNMTLL